MKRMSTLVLALAAMFALAAVMAAGASAVKPTWKVCAKTAKNEEKKYTGVYTDKLCSVAATEAEVEEGKHNKYVLEEGIGKGKPFKGKGGVAILHNVIPGKGDITVECQQFKDSGEVVAPSGVVNVHAEFKKCKSLGFPCKTEGGKKETITTDPGGLAGELGWLDKAHTAAGESLTDQTAPGSGYQAEFECEGVAKVRVHGAVIGSISPVYSVSKEEISSFTVAEYGIGQENSLSNPPAFEEGAEPVGVLLTELNGPETGNTWQPEGGLVSGQEATAINKGERLEIS
jgi:hypothetical protein